MSGKQYPTNSVEFRLCREHYSRKLAYEIQSNDLMLMRLGNIFLYTALPRLEKNSYETTIKNIRESEDRLAALMDPVRYEKVRKEVEEVNKDTDENREAYLQALSGGEPFTGIGDIFNAIANLNNRIASKNADSR